MPTNLVRRFFPMTSLIWKPPVEQATFDVGVEVWLQSYIRPVVQAGSLLALMEFAGEALISLKSSKDKQIFRFTSPRSDLFRHQSCVNLRNLSAVHILLFRGDVFLYSALAK